MFLLLLLEHSDNILELLLRTFRQLPQQPSILLDRSRLRLDLLLGVRLHEVPKCRQEEHVAVDAP